MRVRSSPKPDDADSQDHGSAKPNIIPTSLRTSISPPPSRIRKSKANGKDLQDRNDVHQRINTPNLAALEAGEARIQDHLEYFSSYLAEAVLAPPKSSLAPPTLSIPTFKDLYRRNQHPNGRHFVIHQHDHPIAGLHYDLRLQVNETSSISWAIMYGLPGNVNSRRLNRNATETRVHNVWNHLIETASAATGSLLVWDTGEYEMLPHSEHELEETDDDLSNDSRSELTDCEKLHQAFQKRKLRIRLHGTRLPSNYTLSIRLLPSENRFAQPAKPSSKRRRKASTTVKEMQITPPTSDIDEDEEVPDAHPTTIDASASALEREIAEQEDEEVRRTNAYPGATNNIASIHQRRWFLSMDRYASGFQPLRVNRGSKGGRREWIRRWEGDRLLGFEPFYVMGRDVERSVVTGRSADEIMRDEGVNGFQGRKGWRAVTE